MKILIKIHRSYRNVIAVCDEDLLGKKFEDEKRQLDIKEGFFKGEEYEEKDAVEFIKRQLGEDSTFNIVGKNSLRVAISAGLISEENIIYIGEVPFSIVLV